MSDTDFWTSYLTTVIDVTLPDGSIRRLEQVSVQSPQDWPFGESEAWILTACNPRSVVPPPEVNAERHAELGRQIADLGFPVLPNLGFHPNDPTWNEAGYTIPGIDEAGACELACTWEQNAVFGWTSDAFELVGVLMPGRNRHGWRWSTGR